jgi:hypothetical protein
MLFLLLLLGSLYPKHPTPMGPIIRALFFIAFSLNFSIINERSHHWDTPDRLGKSFCFGNLLFYNRSIFTSRRKGSGQWVVKKS